MRAETEIRLRVLVGETRGNRIHFDCCLRESHTTGEPADYVNIATIAAIRQASGKNADGDEDVAAIEKTERGRENADDRVAATVERDGAADDGGIAAEMRLPELVAEQNDGSGSGLFFRWKKIAAENRVDANECEKIRRDSVAADIFGLGDTGKIEADVVDDGHGGEGTALLAPIEKIGIGNGNVADLFVGFAHEDELRGVFERQRAEEDGVDDAEDGGIGADAESESEDGDGGEAGGFRERADGVFQVLQD